LHETTIRGGRTCEKRYRKDSLRLVYTFPSPMNSATLINSKIAKDQNVDLNANNYTIPELMSILGLENLDDEEDIYAKADYFIQLSASRNNPQMANFFTNIQQILLEVHKNDLHGTPAANLQTTTWYQQEALEQQNPTQRDKITDRKQKIDVYDNTHVPMNREQLGVANTYQVPIAQDTLNPNLKNTFNRFITLDSQYRQSGFPLSTDYVADLSDLLNSVLSIRLYSVQIPYSFYNFDDEYSNTNFYLHFSTDPANPTVIDTIIQIIIPSGNYDPTGLETAINTAIVAIGFVGCTASYDSTTFKMTFTVLPLSTYEGNPVFRTDLVFFESGFRCGVPNTDKFNQTLGWYLGFRNISYPSVTSITGDAAVNTQGPKYCVLSLDDFNQNHINNGLVAITEPSRYIKVPEYVTSSNIVGCAIYGTTFEEDADLARAAGDNILNVAEKTGNSFKKTPFVVGLEPTGKQTLTQSQMYSANEILRNNSITTTYRTSAPTTPDVLAVIPIKPGSPGSLYVEFGGTVQDNKRVYFGPVNLERVRVRLFTDNGTLLNLNGLDWSITIIAEVLYQY
jgi:hypothetical protein